MRTGLNTKKPLAEELRPTSMENVLTSDQSELSLIYKAWVLKKRGSFLLCGPAGSGKTSFIKVLYSAYKGRREQINAVDVGIPQLRETLKSAEDQYKMHGEPTLMFIDEAHRLKAPQQDIFLQGLELGYVLLLAATTEAPGFRFNKAFLSRLRVVSVEPLSSGNLGVLLQKGLEHIKFEGSFPLPVKEVLISKSGGDGRKLLGDLANIVNLFSTDFNGVDELAALKYLSLDVVTGSKQLRADGLSAFIKSMRTSDERAAVYYMGFLLRAKEDPEVMLRRMLIFASEDIGNTNPQAVTFINALWEGFKKVGMPEGVYSLYQGCSYLAKSPKSRRHVEQADWVDQVVGSEIEGVVFPEHFKKQASRPAGKVSNLPPHNMFEK